MYVFSAIDNSTQWVSLITCSRICLYFSSCQQRIRQLLWRLSWYHRIWRCASPLYVDEHDWLPWLKPALPESADRDGAPNHSGAYYRARPSDGQRPLPDQLRKLTLGCGRWCELLRGDVAGYVNWWGEMCKVMLIGEGWHDNCMVLIGEGWCGNWCELVRGDVAINVNCWRMMWQVMWSGEVWWGIWWELGRGDVAGDVNLWGGMSGDMNCWGVMWQLMWMVEGCCGRWCELVRGDMSADVNWWGVMRHLVWIGERLCGRWCEFVRADVRWHELVRGDVAEGRLWIVNSVTSDMASAVNSEESDVVAI